MGPVWLLARADMRRHRGTLLWLGLLMGLVGAAVVAPVIGARRTATAYDRLVSETGAPGFSVALFGRPDVAEALLASPEVKTSSWTASVGVAQELGRQEVRYLTVTFGPARPPGLLEPILRAGRLPQPNAADEVLVNEAFAEIAGLAVGDRLDLKFLSQEEFYDFGQFGEPDGPAVSLAVVGLGRYPVLDNNALGLVLATPAFDTAYGDRVGGGSVIMGDLPGGRAAVDSLREEVDRLAQSSTGEQAPVDDQFTQPQVTSPAEMGATVADTTAVLVTGLLAFAAVAGVAGIVAVGLALGRHHARISEDQLRSALGLTRGQRVLALTLPLARSAVVAAPVTVAAAIAASPLSPSGSVARLEPSPGLDVNVALLAVGALAVVVTTLLLAAGSARLAVTGYGRSVVGARPRPSVLAGLLANFGLGPPTTVGTRMALEPRPVGGTPVRLSLGGAVCGIAGIVAVLGFVASLDRLVETPARFGWPAELSVADVDDATLARLEADPAFDAVADVRTAPVRIDGRVTNGYAFSSVRRGRAPDVGFSVLEGRMPASPDEVLVGPALLDVLDRQVGDTVVVGDARVMAIVGSGLSPSLGSEAFTSAVALTPEALREVAVDQGFREAILHLAPEVDAHEVAEHLGSALEVFLAEPPPEVANLDQVDGLTTWLAAFLALLSVAVVAHAVLESVRRRRTDFAVLRCLGFTPRQTGAAVAAMATTWVGFGLVVGAPLGLVVARAVWGRVAGGLHVGTDLAIPWPALAMLLPAGLAVAGLLAAGPARRVSRARPGTLLRSP